MIDGGNGRGGVSTIHNLPGNVVDPVKALHPANAGQQWPCLCMYVAEVVSTWDDGVVLEKLLDCEHRHLQLL